MGFGARQAVKTLATAVDAAAAPNPTSKGVSATHATATGRKGLPSTPEVMRPARSAVNSTTAKKQSAAQTAAKTFVGARNAQQGLQRGGKRFGEAVWGPFVRLSGVLWLEVSGVFFGIFALFAALAAWRMREAWRLTAINAATHRSFEGAVVMLAVFGYFCISSFVRARRRERRR